MSERQNQYNIGLDKTPANYVPLSPLTFLASYQHGLRGAQLHLGADL